MILRAAINLGLLGCCIGAGVGVYGELQPAMQESLPAAAILVPQEPRPVRFQPPSLADVNEVSRRPMFSPSRRPRSSDRPVPTETVPSPRMRITGLVSVGQTTRVMVELSGGETGIFSAGDVIDGWHIDRIEAQAVVLIRGDARHEIALGVDPEESTNTPIRDKNRRPPTGTVDMTEIID